MATNGINVNISGNASGLTSATQQAASSVQTATQSMQSQLASLQTSFNSLSASLANVSQRLSAIATQTTTAGASAANAVQTSASQASATVGGMAGNMSGFGATLGSAFKGVALGMGAVAVAALGMGLAGAATEVSEYVTENVKLGRQLGISATEASVLSMALGDIYSSGEDYSGALKNLNKQLKTNEEGLNQMGLKTRDNAGNLKSGNEVMNDAVKLLSTYKTGQDQAVVAMQLFGKSAEESLKFLKLTPEALEAARKKTEELGLTVTQQGVESVAKYRAALNDLQDVGAALKNVVGEALIPIITELSNMFSDVGPTAVNVLREVMTSLITVFDAVSAVVSGLYDVVSSAFSGILDISNAVFGSTGGAITGLELFKNVMSIVQVAAISFRIGVQEVFAAISGYISHVGTVLQGFANIAISVYNSIKSGSLGPMQSAFAANNKAITTDLQNTVNKMTAIAAKGSADIQNALMGQTRVKDNTPSKIFEGGGTKTFSQKSGGGAGGKDNASALQNAQFALVKAEVEAEQNMIKQKQKAELAGLQDLYARKKITIEDFYAKKNALEDKDFQEQQRLIQLELTQNASKKPKDAVERIKIQTEQIKLEGKLQVVEAQRAEAAIDNARKLNAELEQRKSQMEMMKLESIKANSVLEVNLEKVKNEQLLALKQIDNQQAIQLEIEREQRLYDIAKQFSEQKKLLKAGDVEAQMQINAELEALEREHILKVAELKKQSNIEQNKDVVSSIENGKKGLADLFTGVATGQKTLEKGFKDLFNTVIQKMIELESKKLAESIFSSSGISGAAGGGGGGGGFMGAIGSFLGMIPSFDVGTNYVPNDGLAMIHKGEKIVPAKYNNDSANNTSMSVNNNFILNSAPDKRTQAQIAAQAGSSIQNAMKRNK